MPHRVAFVADPQLVDPHTYPGRPWPLSSLTVLFTDVYLRRAYERIQRDLDPNSIIFLGDLFDGGREWSTPISESPDDRWHGYGESFWQGEYRRFSNIFFRDWRGDRKRVFQSEELLENTRIIASLPGNHDLGFGANIAIPVRDRFNAFFGQSNRVDIIGNHTFVSIDSVSLSARDQQGSDPAIYRPAEEFLESARSLIAETEHSHVNYIADTANSSSHKRYRQAVEESNSISGAEESPSHSSQDPLGFPTILLTHVPLHRPQGTPCGPLRERYPPTKPPRGQTEPVFPDNRNSLHVDGGFGWQYQNVITQATSSHILNSLGGAVSLAFSGDDHDYCEVVHRAYPSPGGGVREITVKSLSWAMGVRRPGFVLASLWHELDADGKPAPRLPGEPETGPGGAGTAQTHLCLLPDQLGVFVSYIVMAGSTVILLAARAVYRAFGSASLDDVDNDADDEPLLPLAASHHMSTSPFAGNGSSSAEREKLSRSPFPPSARFDANRSDASGRHAAGANGGARARNGTGSGLAAVGVGSYGLTTGTSNPLDIKKRAYDVGVGGGRVRDAEGWARPRAFFVMFRREIWIVARAVLPVFVLLIRW